METIKDYVAHKKQELKAVVAELNPSIAIIQVGHVPASDTYVKNKIKDCTEVGMPCKLVSLPETTSEAELLLAIDALNKDPSVDGFIVQLPLPKGISEATVKASVAKEKDIDGFNPLNTVVSAATPSGIITYLEDQGYNFTDKNAVVIGRSNIVGRPMAKLLLDRSCNVSIIHSKTSPANKKALLRLADLIIVATGHRNTLTNDDLLPLTFTSTHHTTFVFDVGMNRNDEGKLCGDCESLTIVPKTPVPGGVGLLTRIQLINNTIALKRHYTNNNSK